MLTPAELRAIERIEEHLKPEDDKGLTVLEWARVRKCGERKVREKFLKPGIAIGRVVRGKRSVTMLNGVTRRQDVYRIVEGN